MGAPTTATALTTALADPAPLERDARRTTARVTEAVAHATASLLDGDAEAVEIVAARRCVIDLECRAIEEAAVGGGHDPDVVLAAVRVAASLSAAGNVALDIAACAPRVPAHTLTPRVRGLLARLGAEARHVLIDVGQSAGEPPAAQLDDLHHRLVAELFSGTVPLATAVELTLVGRHYEHLGTHALAVAVELARLSRTGR